MCCRDRPACLSNKKCCVEIDLCVYLGAKGREGHRENGKWCVRIDLCVYPTELQNPLPYCGKFRERKKETLQKKKKSRKCDLFFNKMNQGRSCDQCFGNESHGERMVYWNGREWAFTDVSSPELLQFSIDLGALKTLLWFMALCGNAEAIFGEKLPSKEKCDYCPFECLRIVNKRYPTEGLGVRFWIAVTNISATIRASGGILTPEALLFPQK